MWTQTWLEVWHDLNYVCEIAFFFVIILIVYILISQFPSLARWVALHLWVDVRRILHYLEYRSTGRVAKRRSLQAKTPKIRWKIYVKRLPEFSVTCKPESVEYNTYRFGGERIMQI